MSENKIFTIISIVIVILGAIFLKIDFVMAGTCEGNYAYTDYWYKCNEYPVCPAGWEAVDKLRCGGCITADGGCNLVAGIKCCAVTIHRLRCRKYCGDGYWTERWRCLGSTQQKLFLEQGCASGACYEREDWRYMNDCGAGYWYVPEQWKCSGTWQQRLWMNQWCQDGTCHSGTGWRNITDCGTGEWLGGLRCLGSMLQRQYINRYCYDGACYSPIEWRDQQPCYSDYWTENYRCSGNYLQRLYVHRGCSGVSCYNWSEWVNIQQCAASCCIDNTCRIPITKTCTADNAKDSSISELGNSIDDVYCTWNVRQGCQIKSGIAVVAGQLSPDYWEGESCDGKGSSVLHGEKKVIVDDINKYIIKARVNIDDNSRVRINNREVPGLKQGCCGWSNWVDVTKYFETGENLIKFEAEDTCSGSRYFNLDWDVSCKSHTSFICFNDDVYWFDSCGRREDKKQECQATCFPGKLEMGCQGGTYTCTNGVCGFPLKSCVPPQYTQAGTICECNEERGTVVRACNGLGSCATVPEKCDIACGSDEVCQGLKPGDDYPDDPAKQCCKGEEKLPKWKEISP